MSTISPANGMSVQAIKQLFGSGTGRPAANPAEADGGEAAAKKIQELAAQKAEGAKKSALPFEPGSIPPGHIGYVLNDGTKGLLGPGENPPWVDIEEAKKESREAVADIAANISDTINFIVGNFSAGSAGGFKRENQPLPEDPLPEGALGRAEFNEKEFYESFLNSQLGRLKTLLGEEPPIETMPDGTRRLGQFDLFRDVSYGRGKDEHFRISARWDGDNHLAISIIDPKTGESSPFRRSESSFPERLKGKWVNTQA